MKRLLIILLLVGVFSVNKTLAQHPSCVAAINQFSPDTLMRFVEELIGERTVWIDTFETRIESRFHRHPGNNLARAYLSNQFRRYGFTVQENQFNLTGVNVVAYKTGSQFPDKGILFCAHYDCVGTANQPFQGADDNASGVAALLETARLLKDIDFPYTVMLIAWDEEEIGLLGSRAWAPAGDGQIDPIAVVNMDMIAYDNNQDSMLMLHVRPEIPSTLLLALRISEINELYEGRLNVFIRNPGDPGSDHQAFWLTGSNAIGYSEDYDNDFNPHWHRISDSVKYFNIPYFNNMARMAVASTCELAINGKITGSGKVLHARTARLLFNNPIEKYLWVKLDNGTPIESIELYNMHGKMQWYERQSPNNEQHHLPDNLSNGIYLMKVQTQYNTYTQRILIQR
jgi:hypothetical protein